MNKDWLHSACEIARLISPVIQELPSLSLAQSTRDHQQVCVNRIRNYIQSNLAGSDLPQLYSTFISIYQFENSDSHAFYNIDNLPWFLLSESFYDSLFFLPRPSWIRDSSIYWHLPKTAGTSLLDLIHSTLDYPLAILLYPGYGFDYIASLPSNPRRLFRGIEDFVNIYTESSGCTLLIRCGHINLQKDLERLDKTTISEIPRIGTTIKHPMSILESHVRYFISCQILPPDNLHVSSLAGLPELPNSLYQLKHSAEILSPQQAGDLKQCAMAYLSNNFFKSIGMDSIASLAAINPVDSVAYLSRVSRSYPMVVVSNDFSKIISHLSHGRILNSFGIETKNASLITNGHFALAGIVDEFPQAAQDIGYNIHSIEAFDFLQSMVK